MANQSTKYRKFLAGAASAALVATAIVPTALAAELSDIKGNTHEGAINSLVDAGIIKGYPDGTFKPNQELTRNNVVKMLGKWLETLGKAVPADYKTVQRFDDVPLTADEELVKYAALVKDNGVFNGSNGKLLAADKISRENMALVLVRAFDAVNDSDLVSYVNAQTFTKEVTDLAAAKAEAQPYINVLDFFNITTAKTFNPKGNVTRGQFATFVNNVINTEVPVVKEAGVESVSAITKTNVKVTFKALEEANASFTVEVKDDKGNVVEVTPVSLEKGETEATLTFKTPFGVDPVGVWTVGGVKYDNDAVKNFNDIVAAAAYNNEVTTLAALKKAGLNNIKDEKITTYVTAINASTTKEKLADIQVIIDKTNETSVTAEEAKAAVKAVNDATNQVQLLAALQNKAFVHVNADWIVDYKTEIDAAKVLGGSTFTTTDTVAEIQAIVDAKNGTKITAADTAATTVVTQNAVTDLISNFTADDVAPATTKAAAIKASNIKSAVFGVKEATTSATVYNALVKLSSLDSTVLPASALNANLKANYLTAKNAYNFGTLTTAAVKSSITDVADAAALNTAATGIVNLKTTAPASTTADVKAALQKLADVTSHTADKFDMTKVKDGSLATYLIALDTKVLDDVNTAAEVTAIIAGVNSAANLDVNLATVKNASATVAQVRDALTELAAGVATNATTTAYLNASSQVKLEVAQFIVDNRSSLAGSLTALLVTAEGGTGYADAVIETAQAAQVAKVADFNAIGNLSGANISATKAKLDTYAYAPYVALTITQKVAVAEEINKLTKPGTTVGSTVFLDFSQAPDAVTTLAQANAYIDAAIAK